LSLSSDETEGKSLCEGMKLLKYLILHTEANSSSEG
jgi:hypothetical protein